MYGNLDCFRGFLNTCNYLFKYSCTKDFILHISRKKTWIFIIKLRKHSTSISHSWQNQRAWKSDSGRYPQTRNGSSGLRNCTQIVKAANGRKMCTMCPEWIPFYIPAQMQIDISAFSASSNRQGQQQQQQKDTEPADEEMKEVRYRMQVNKTSNTQPVCMCVLKIQITKHLCLRKALSTATTTSSMCCCLLPGSSGWAWADSADSADSGDGQTGWLAGLSGRHAASIHSATVEAPACCLVVVICSLILHERERKMKKNKKKTQTASKILPNRSFSSRSISEFLSRNLWPSGAAAECFRGDCGQSNEISN